MNQENDEQLIELILQIRDVISSIGLAHPEIYRLITNDEFLRQITNQENGEQLIERILRIRDVISLTGLSRTQIYRLIARNEFPSQIKLTSGGKITGWLLSEILTWIDSRVAESRGPGGEGFEKCASEKQSTATPSNVPMIQRLQAPGRSSDLLQRQIVPFIAIPAKDPP